MQDGLFMPKPLFGDNARHAHPSIALEESKPLFAGKDTGLSQMALYYAGGLLSMLARSAPSVIDTNSYKRLVPVTKRR